MTATMNTTAAGGEVNTPSNGDNVPEWYARHVEAVTTALNNGTLVIGNATRIYTSWPTADSPPPYSFCTIRYLGPPPESNNDFVNRHMQEVAADFSSHPPIP